MWGKKVKVSGRKPGDGEEACAVKITSNGLIKLKVSNLLFIQMEMNLLIR